tara:strand:- start:578 stop:796 length:219 start_codon:yes stop_codon:yes gene_type:complete
MATKQWVRFNEDSRASKNREAYVSSNGGEFVCNEIGRGWVWRETPKKKRPAPKPVVEKKKTTKKTIKTKKSK